MKPNPYLERIIAELKSVSEAWDELFTGEFSIREVLDLLGTLVEAAEAVITAPKSGKDKHQLVKDAFDYFDEKYQLISKMDTALVLPWFIEPFDGPILRGAIDLLISMAVAIFNKTIWKN